MDALNSFDEFHIEQTAQIDVSEVNYNQNIQKIEESLVDVNYLIKQLVQEKSSFLNIFQSSIPTKMQVTTENWQSLLDETTQKIEALKKETDILNESLSSSKEKAAEFDHINDMLTRMNIMGADLAAMEELKLIYVAIASVPVKNFNGLEIALSGLPVFINRCSLTNESIFACLAISKKHQAEIEKIMKTHHAEIFQIPEKLPHDVSEALKEVNKQIKENSEKRKGNLQFS